MNQQQSDPHEFTIYSRIISKSAPLPIILAVFLGITPFLNFSLGPIQGLIKLAIWILSGILYVNNLLVSGEKVSYINAPFNAAILAGIASLVGELIYWIVSAVQGYSNYANASTIATSFFQAIIIGALTAAAWLYYKTNNK
jgi:hypothetical protein